jgi:hypothetical protein
MRIKTLTSLPDYRLQLEFSDGTQGVVDLSSKVGTGVFAAWRDPQAFARVRVGANGQAEWPDEVELCPDNLYLLATGRLPRDVVVGVETAHA